MTQEKALALLKSGKNIFLTGSAGTGKTYIINHYINYLKERKVGVAVTASTGIAATHINGMTIHAWSGIGVKEHLTNRDIQNLQEKKYLLKNFDKVKVLIIDEISMLHKNQLNLVDKVLRAFKENDSAFGGVQVIFCGDFFQLPPIGNQGETSKEKFAFMSQAWLNANLTVCYLTEQFRQEDNELNTILNEIRTGQISEWSLKHLKNASKRTLQFDVEPTKLYSHNYDVDRINLEQLAQLAGKEKEYIATTKGNPKLIETLSNSVLASEQLQLKIGARVMFVKNNHEKGYVNGTLGTVAGFSDKGFPSIKTLQGKFITAEPENWSIIDESGKTLASYTQVPVRLAWAITVHKCQGMTLDAAEIDLSKTFEKGQGYVALSRLKNLNNLVLYGFNETALEVDRLAKKADQRFQELSYAANIDFEFSHLEKEAITFIKKCGGLVNIADIEKERKKSKEFGGKKLSTYDITKTYLAKKLSISEIASERGIAEGTIATHIITISHLYPEFSLSYYRPDSKIIKQVKKHYLQQKKELHDSNDTISFKRIYTELNGEVSYQDIKLSIAFLLREK
jgi:ATP-dependent exoDNAse (exonuclease V) alpha subunit